MEVKPIVKRTDVLAFEIGCHVSRHMKIAIIETHVKINNWICPGKIEKKAIQLISDRYNANGKSYARAQRDRGATKMMLFTT